MPQRPADLPWDVAPRHTGSVHHEMLLTAARVRAGEELGLSERRRFDSWLEDLHAADAVVHYDPATQEGWFYVPRRAGRDRELVRKPELSDAPSDGD